MRGLIYGLFFCSGLSGLIYQVIWVRGFGNVFGNTIHSAALVVAVFMLGLGAGSYACGRWADRRYRAQPESLLRVYGGVEALIAVLGLAISILLPHLTTLSAALSWYVRDANGWWVLSLGSLAARACVATLILLPITFLMGGTLTLLVRHFVRGDPERHSSVIALLYGVNTAGAALGCFLTDFWLVPAFGVFRTQMVAVGLNVVAAVGAWAATTFASTPAPARRTRAAAGGAREPVASDGGAVVLTGTALALSGFAALGLEIVWFRHTAILLGGFRTVFSLLLTVVLLGIGLGGLASAFVQRTSSSGIASSRAAACWLMVVQGVLAAAALAGASTADVTRIDAAVATTPVSPAAELWLNVAPILALAAVPAFLMGFAFPLGNAVIQRVESAVGRRAGALYLANTLGGVTGSLVTGFVLLPFAGLQQSFAYLAIVATLSALPLFIVAWRRTPETAGAAAGTRFLPAGALGASWVVAGAALVWWVLLPSGALIARALPPLETGERQIAVDEGLTEVIAVTDVAGKGRRLMTNGHSMSATWPLSQRYMRALAHVPLLVLERPSSVLVIGFGVGNTTHAASLHPTVQRVEVADLSRDILSHASDFANANHNVLSDPRVAVYVNDGRHHLSMVDSRGFDLVTLEPPPVGYAGVASLYSREFYELARARLTDGGYISQWLPVYQVPASSTLAMIRAFIDVFPQSVLLSGAGTDLLLLGTTTAIEIDPVVIEQRLVERPDVGADLARLDLGSAREIVGMFVGSAQMLASATRAALPVTDDRPIQEYEVHSLVAPDTRGLSAIADLRRAAEWCPRCYDGGVPAPVVDGLDVYFALLDLAYASPPSDFARIRDLVPGARRVAGSAYLGAVVPETSRLHNLLGIAFASRGRMNEAIDEFRTALTLAPNEAETNWHLGSALASQGRWEVARDHLERAVALDPSNVAARCDLARVLLRSRDFAGAEEQLRGALALDPTLLDAVDDLGVALAAQGKWSEAVHHFERVVAARPNAAEARRNLEMARARAGTER